MKAAIINLGCKVNKYESDSMKDKLVAAGIEIVDEQEIADVYIVNTCSVTNVAQRKSRQMLRRAKKCNPDAVIIAAGCYVNAEYEVLQKEEFVDVVVGNNCKKDIVQVIKDYFDLKKQDCYIDINKTREYEEMGCLEVLAMNHQRAYIKIQDGCNQFCSYCIIPYTRGRVRSRKPELILREIRSLAREGVKEFVLTGIHISSYGVDFSKDALQYDDRIEGKASCDDENRIMNLGQLICEIAKIDEVQRIRLGSLEPRIITPEFLRVVGKTDKLCPHFHLSLQSACNDTLKRMNRKYTIEEFEEKCQMLRDYFEMPAITTDVIVGFPGETEEEFEITMEHLRKLNLYEIHVFKYSVRSGTAAEKLPNQIPEMVKNIRSEKVLQLTAAQKLAYEESVKVLYDEVLVEEKVECPNPSDGRMARILQETNELQEKGNYFTGHTKRYVKVYLQSDRELTNEIVGVKIL